MRTRLLLAVFAMVVVVAASNILVQFPVEAHLGPFNLAAFLTWGAFTYPVAFLVTDLTNRHFGPRLARRVVIAGFAVAVAVSVYLSTGRIATASGTAFVVGQLVDIFIFSRLRAKVWWLPPLVSPLLGSALDTGLFFTLAFAPLFGGLDTLFGLANSSLPMPAPLLGIGPMVPLWTSLAVGDFSVKFLAACVLLAPYRVLMGSLTRATRLAAA